ncbi:MAG: TIGR04076 family protein [Calditrichaeota bacterium]|nr:MAG: TIGR04076 family protein [Calditrichota bacterium]
MDLIVKVKEIKGHCPVYKVGDSFKLKEGYQLVSDIPVCMHALPSLLPHYNAMRFAQPSQWGAASKADKSKAYFQCLDPYEYTDGGTVIFEVCKADASEDNHTV